MQSQIASIISILDGNYPICVVTGSAAICYLLERMKGSTPDQEKKRQQFLSTIIPNDVDICVTGKHRFEGYRDMPKKFGNFVRKQHMPYKSCTYLKDDISFDLIFVEGTIRYVTIDGINIILPSFLSEEYADTLGIFGRNKDYDKEKISACELLSSMITDFTIQKSSHLSRQSPKTQKAREMRFRIKPLPFSFD